MTSEIPKMPEVHTLRRHEATQTLREWGRDLAVRLEASNALCTELAEALGVADEALNFLARYYLPDGRDAREAVKAALAKFKEATR